MKIPVSLLAFLAVLLSLLVSMPVYVVAGRRRDADQEGKGGQLFGGTGDFLLHWFMWAIAPLTTASLRLGLTPGFYNYLGLALGLGAGVFIGMGHLSLGGWAIVLCGVADILDGRIARLTGVASGYGDFIDSTFDRYVEVAAFLGFLVYLRHEPWGPFVAAAAMGGSLVVSYARARGEVLGVLCTGGLMQRGERLVLTCLACLVDPALSLGLGWPPGRLVEGVLALIAVATLVTAVHRTIWIARRLGPQRTR